MPVPMVNVRIVGMTMMQFRMSMAVTVGLRSLAMRVMRIMAMAMLVFEWFVPVWVLVSFRHVQPRTKSHQCRSDQQLGRQIIAQHENGNGRTHKRGERKVGSRSGCAEGPKRENKQVSDSRQSREYQRPRRSARYAHSTGSRQPQTR